MSHPPDVLTDREIHLPPRLHDVPLFELPIQRRAVNALLAAGLLWVGDLHGRPLASLFRIHRFGRRSISRLLEALAVVWARSGGEPPAQALPGDHIPLASLGFGEVALAAMAARGVSTAGALRRAPEFLFLDAPALARVLQPALQAGGPAPADPGALRAAVLAAPDAARLLAIPREFWPLAVAALEIGRHTVSALGSKGIVRLGQLDGLAAEDLPWLGGITPGGAAGVERAVRRICRLSPEPAVFARWTDQSGTLRLPDLPLTVLHKVARAERFDEELRALVGCLRPRNAALVLARWGVGREVPVTFAWAAHERGVSPQRGRQIVAASEARLERSGIILPLGSRIVNLLGAAGGPLTTSRLLALLDKAGVRTSAAALGALPRLARMGLVPPVEHVAEGDRWSVPTTDD